MAKKLTAKQIRFFGTKRQKAALRAKRSRHAPATKKRANPPRKKAAAHKTKLRKSKGGATKRRRNPVPELIALTYGNPARKKGHKTMAAKKTKNYKRKSSAASRSNAGRRSTKRKMTHRRHSNPMAIGKPMDWLKGGVGVIGGAVGSRVIPQIAGAANTGFAGYAMNFGVAIGLGLLAHAFLKDAIITATVIAGGFASTLVRIATDNTQYGSFLALSGVGDYVVWNFSQPQRVTGKNASRIDTAWRKETAMAQDPMMAGSIDRFRG